MKRLTILCAIVALCGGNVMSADNNKDEGKKVPPGLQKKGAVPPGQAKKKGEAVEVAPAAAPAPANTTVAAPAPATAKPTTTTVAARTVPLADQKATLDANRRAINQATESNPAKHKIALDHISKLTGVTIEHLKEQDKGFPDASDTGLLLGNVVAKTANVKFGDVIQARRSGKQWDEIAQTHNVNFALLVQKTSELAQALR